MKFKTYQEFFACPSDKVDILEVAEEERYQHYKARAHDEFFKVLVEAVVLEGIGKHYTGEEIVGLINAAKSAALGK